jgi:class 3 adenylate cyclase
MPSTNEIAGIADTIDDDDSAVLEDDSVVLYDDSVFPSDRKPKGRSSALTGAEAERMTLGRKESRAVSVLRVIVIAVIAFAAVVVSTCVYLYTRNVEEETFETQFAAYSNRIVESFHDSIEDNLGATDALSVLITSFALSTGATFPNVTVPNFEVIGASSRVLADALVVFWLPLVTDETREGWEEYSVMNQNQLMTSFLSESALQVAQNKKFKSDRSLQDAPVFNERIWGLQGAAKPEGTGPYLPLWQITPTLPFVSLLNTDMLDYSNAAESFREVLRSEEAVLGISTSDEGADENTIAIFNAFLTYGQYRDSIEQYSGDPISSISYPVFDSFGADRKVAGVLATNIYWKLYFEHILPPGANGIICVLENTLNQTFTYEIHGPDATYLGKGDMHDSRYDYLEVTDDMTFFVQARAGLETRSYTAVNLNSDYNQYVIRIYPSVTMENDYVTTAPVIFAVGVAVIFVFTSLVFIFYDWLVQRRQKVVMDKAVKSGAIVSSLYPEVVRDRLFQSKEEDKKEKAPNKEKIWRVASMSKNGTAALEDSVEAASKSRPIADIFPDATVVFADIVGFTSWSSKRQPTEVFELLETLYHTFDEIAAKHGVFKIETIGDCYMAVTGLPEPQEDHAVRMVNFARECMIMKAPQVLRGLSHQLGEDTSELGFRVGLHSGSVTGGVLRGSKSRFQLFGDTVNTASRMESNGMKGRLHVSQTTADELTKAGKSHWLIPREDLVVAKGKGEMQTYWLTKKSSVTKSSCPSVLDLDTDLGADLGAEITDKV